MTIFGVRLSCRSIWQIWLCEAGIARLILLDVLGAVDPGEVEHDIRLAQPRPELGLLVFQVVRENLRSSAMAPDARQDCGR